MGREATITAEQVAAAADGLVMEGRKPSARMLRERLGDTGSLGTIQTMLNAWRARQHPQQAAALALPAALQRAILDYMGSELAAARTALEAELAEQQQATSDLARENERQAGQVESLENLIERLQADKAGIEGRADQLAGDLAQAREDASKARQEAEAARTELAKALLRLEDMPRLVADLERTRAELTQERVARVAGEQAAAVASARLEAEQASRQQAAAAAVRCGEQLMEVQAQRAGEARQAAEKLNAANLAVQAGQARLEAAAREMADAKAATEKAREAARKAQEEAAELRGAAKAGKPKVTKDQHGGN